MTRERGSVGPGGRYRLEEVIGVGSFATVHRATDVRLSDTVVVKMLAENHSLNPEIRERFIAEGRSLRRVAGPHVVTVHDIGESERQQPWLVLEHADRGTLAARVDSLRSHGWTATPGDVLTLARHLAAALEGVHAAQLVHRDLSPTNVLLASVPGGTGAAADSLPPPASELIRPDERVVVADLGMCKDLALNSGLTVAGGTTGFRPPELSSGPSVIDARADLWSLSALLDWLCEDADLPPDLATVLRHGRAVDPADRHADVATWLADVEGALSERVAAGEPATGHDDTAVRPRRRGAIQVALVTLAVLAGVALGWAGRGLDDPGSSTSTARVSIEGPQELTVRESATFTLDSEGVQSWVWVLPTGGYVAQQESITLTPSGSGTARLVLQARDQSGRELEAVHQIVVSE